MDKKYPYLTLSKIKQDVLGTGFAKVVFLKFKNPDSSFRRFYLKYIRNFWHADMKYLEKTSVKFNIKKLWPYPGKPGSMMICIHPYKNQNTEIILKKSKHKIARYAWGKDYHNILKKKLQRIVKPYGLYRIIIDSAPMPERYYARLAGMGFIGRNGMLIHPSMGSYFLISTVLLERKWSRSILKKERQHNTSIPKTSFTIFKKKNKNDMLHWCADCTKCMDSCPTNAILENGIVDSNRCISYWTIESKKDQNIPKSLNFGKWIFGCDICQMVCPYNKASLFTLDKDFAPTYTSLKISEGNFKELEEKDLYGLPLKRAGIHKLAQSIKFVSS